MAAVVCPLTAWTRESSWLDVSWSGRNLAGYVSSVLTQTHLAHHHIAVSQVILVAGGEVTWELCCRGRSRCCTEVRSLPAVFLRLPLRTFTWQGSVLNSFCRFIPCPRTLTRVQVHSYSSTLRSEHTTSLVRTASTDGGGVNAGFRV